MKIFPPRKDHIISPPILPYPSFYHPSFFPFFIRQVYNSLPPFFIIIIQLLFNSLSLSSSTYLAAVPAATTTMDSEAEATTTTTMDAAQFHVLAVDDSIIDRKLIERLLKTSSYRVTTVPSVSKALEFLGLLNTTSTSTTTSNEQQVVVNLIISDYSMPDMTGYDLLRKIKDSDSFKDIPFVIMSSENIPSRINRCLEQGAQDFFLKPVKMSDVNKLKPYLMRSDNNPRIIPSAAAAAAAKRKTMEAAAADHDGFLLSPHSRSSSRSRFINNMEMTC